MVNPFCFGGLHYRPFFHLTPTLAFANMHMGEHTRGANMGSSSGTVAVSRWMKDKAVMHTEERVRASWALKSEVYMDYSKWMANMGDVPLGPTNFARALLALGVKSATHKGKACHSISLTHNDSRPNASATLAGDSVGAWASARAYTLDPDSARLLWVRRSDAYCDYHKWAQAMGASVCNKASFKSRLRRSGVRCLVYRGIEVFSLSLRAASA